ncbi:MAG: eukaryotic translation initiation factor 3 subunit A [Alyxoria varia]|nr:MAG: eukaryotic translation initiation factor 3 subunit A [Alyxoria varia]
MPPKPENILKRAQELTSIGHTQTAHTLLHEYITSKRAKHNPIATMEPAMESLLELSVDLKKGKAAKDALYSYKNYAQNTNIGTIEAVVTKFIQLSSDKVSGAQQKADDIESSTKGVDDLEALETPESILLSTVSSEQSRDRTDRAIVTPWLKFLWESYRSVLDILKNNARLEIRYQATAIQAFQFCADYARKTEFRRLCELLRNHLQNAAKYQQQAHAINLSDPDTLQRHLDTRFQQLNVAVDLELWQEAFRSIEDIHMLLNITKRPPRNIMMANYFEKLAQVFLVSENYLFHAASLTRYHGLLRVSAHAVATGQGSKKDNPAVTDTDLANCASFVVLSALSIPVISTSRSRGNLVDVDETKKNKNQRLTSLLGLGSAPSRASLINEVTTKGLLKRARPEIRQLYDILEVDFHPLSICKKISPILTQIGADPEMGKYVKSLKQVILTRLFQQLSQVYESVSIGFVLGLFPEHFEISKGTIEKFIMNGCKKGDLAIRIDHAKGVLTFDSDVFSSAKALHPGSGAGSAESEVSSVQRLQSTPAEIVRSQLTRLAKTLYITCQHVDPSFSEDQRLERAAALQRAEANAKKEHLDTLERKTIIEKKKEAASSAQAQKEKEEATRKRIRAQQQQEAEIQRLEQEQRERDQRRLKEQQARVQREEAEKQLNELKSGSSKIKLDLGEVDLDDIDSGRIRAMKIAALEKEKSELSERLRVTGKRMDHLERAYRREEARHLPEDKEAQMEQDREEYERTTEQTLKDAKEKHASDVALKRRLTRLFPLYESFRAEKQEERKAEFEKRRKAAQKELEAKKQARISEHRERKARERKEREERERQAREEEERAEREAEEKAVAEEEKKRKDAERRARMEEERKKLDEQAAKQRQREEEADERRRQKAAAAGAAPAAREPAAAREPPTQRPSVLGEKAGGWREREAAKRAAGGGSGERDESPAPAPAAPARSGGGYVPPHLRGDGARTGSTPPPPRDDSTPPPGRGPPPPREPPQEREAPSARSNAGGGGGGKYVPPSMRRAGGGQ